MGYSVSSLPQLRSLERYKIVKETLSSNITYRAGTTEKIFFWQELSGIVWQWLAIILMELVIKFMGALFFGGFCGRHKRGSYPLLF